MFENYLENLKKRKGKVFTKEQVLAEQVWLYFGKRFPFSRIMKMIKEKGHQFVFEVFSEIKNSEAKNHLSLFIWKIYQTKVDWQSKKK